MLSVLVRWVRKFSKAVKSLGKKYGQDSVLIQKKPGGSASLQAYKKRWTGWCKEHKCW